jgi:tetratricopeptide (TPR) repeat protein
MAREDGDPSWYSRAGRLLGRASALAPKDASVLAARGSLAVIRHDFPRGLALARRSLALRPDSAYALGVAVDALVEIGRYGEARRTLQHMLDVHPGLDSYSRASYVLELDGHVGAARHALELAVAAGAPAAENTAWAQLYLGNVEWNHGRYDHAARAYRAALRTYPGFVHARAAQARLAAARGRHAHAIRLLRGVVARYPVAAYVAALGDAYAAAGMPDRARAQYALVRAEQRLAAASGVNTDVEVALFEADHGRPLRALALARRATARPHGIAADDALAWALHRAGRDRAALRAANRALRLGTRDATMLYHRGAIEAALGMRPAAVRDLRLALRTNPHFSPRGEPDARRLLRSLA